MRELSVEEGSVVIAVFDGWVETKYHNRFKKDISERAIVEMYYHSSWDWQVPTWSKIVNAIGRLWENGNVLPDNWFDLKHEYFKAITNDDKKTGFDIIVKLIKWYNQQNK